MNIEPSLNRPQPVPVWSGSFRVFVVDVKCHTLDGGERIIERDSFHELMEAMAHPTLDAGDIEAFASWRAGGRQ